MPRQQTPSLSCPRDRGERLSLPRLEITAMIVSLCLFSGFNACETKPPLPLQGRLDASVEDEQATQDMEPHDPVPEAAANVFQELPFPPKYILRKPGDAVSNLRAQIPNLQEMYSPRFLAVSYPDGPFKTVVYMLDKRLNRVEGVSATFQNEYTQKIEHKHLIDAMSERLGRAIKFSEEPYEGHRWTNLDYRIDLRIDRRVRDIEVLFHLRGAETLERTEKGLLK